MLLAKHSGVVERDGNMRLDLVGGERIAIVGGSFLRTGATLCLDQQLLLCRRMLGHNVYPTLVSGKRPNDSIALAFEVSGNSLHHIILSKHGTYSEPEPPNI
ncbi:hypothetical protein CGK74_15315 [Thauera propionica]|uniref:Uncharacterized protein n=1 Tax=Thauera propionica TaxID=2019431 RepID=A0A235EWL6_9RHOO|nr:hypothetical protein CGK74_15315 [Thauera propionica]